MGTKNQMQEWMTTGNIAQFKIQGFHFMLSRNTMLTLNWPSHITKMLSTIREDLT